MAITNNGTVNSLDSSLLPSGYTRPTVTLISDYKYQYDITLEVDKVTADNATKSTTMTNIIGVASVGIAAQVDAIIAEDFIASRTVTHYTDWWDLNSNVQVNTTSDFLNADLVTYTCKVRIYIKTA